MGLLVERLRQKGLLKTSSISQLLAAIVCDPKEKKCMYRLCPKCCYEELEVQLPEEPQEIVWEHWEMEKTNDRGKISLLHRVQMEQVRLILVAPFRPHMSWFSMIPTLLGQPWMLPLRGDLLSQAGGKLFHCFPAGLRLVA